MIARYRSLAVLVALLLVAGCGRKPPPTPGGAAGAGSDPEAVRTADVSILFVGNSHTAYHDLPGLVCKMIRSRHPDKKVYSHLVIAAYLEDAARDPACREEIEARPWKHVVLQAQKVSMSGKFNYSRKEGIELAKLAKGRGAAVLFYSEWGRAGVEGETERHEKIYTEMARDAGVEVAAVGRAWELALARKPDLPLHDMDGNHQSPLGAFLTACVLVGRLTGESPAALASFPYAEGSEADRKLLAEAAAKSIDQGGPQPR